MQDEDNPSYTWEQIEVMPPVDSKKRTDESYKSGLAAFARGLKKSNTPYAAKLLAAARQRYKDVITKDVKPNGQVLPGA